jgi:hypothetical protein
MLVINYAILLRWKIIPYHEGLYQLCHFRFVVIPFRIHGQVFLKGIWLFEDEKNYTNAIYVADANANFSSQCTSK